ncbi:hypothetical protein CMV_022036 [Castanea mollissima]|uniref:Uncharacterized protein n=1 Tax=Castanea mollissima TaxID=60419 RepID=A0A8J4QVE5_9ROSI|nr:hypothetical protein CMV_022036 [Castanea mollissima]
MALQLALFIPVKESAKVLIMFNQRVVYECFVHHPLVILLTALEASNALLAYWVVFELLTNWTIYANKHF